MVEGRGGEGDRLNACELLDLSAGRVIALTDADMPPAEPTGSGDLGLLCIYGGPGSQERYALQLAEAEEEAEAEAEEDTGAESGSAEGTSTAAPTSITMPTSTATSSAAPEYETDGVPDTVAAGVTKPRGGPQKALAGQPAMLGVRYACSEIRGDEAASVAGGPPAAPGAPPVVDPDLDTAYLDCVAGPTGGGVEVHTIFIADNDLWHVTLIKPETPRSPAAEAAALAGLHRLAAQILA